MEDLGPFVVPYTRTHHFTADSNGREYRVFVSTPTARNPDAPLPVLYALDANGGFGTVVETARMMMLGNEIEQAIIVGIGYNAGLREMMALRNFELSTSHDPAFVERAATQGQVIEEGGLGGAPGFLQFIGEQLAPFIESQYGGSPDDRGIWGFSLGGLFATFALLQPNPVFQRYIIGSPSLWWHDRAMFQLEEERSKQDRRLDARVFISAGELEELPGLAEMAPFRMVSNAIEMAGRLGSRGYEGFSIKSHIFPGESHQSAIGPTIARGLRVVYGQ